MEENNEGMTLGKIFHAIALKKWIALIIAAVITVVGIIALYFGLSKPKKEYTMTLVFNRITTNNTLTLYDYADGTSFYASDFVSEETLTAVKNKRKAYSNIDVDDMLSKNNVSWSDEITNANDVDKNNVSVIPADIRHNISFSINAKYFSSAKQARSFMTDLVYYPADKFKAIDLDYNIHLQADAFSNALKYEDQIKMLEDQMNYIGSLYEALPNISVDGNTLVAAYRQEYTAWKNRQDLGALRTEAAANYYLKNWEEELDKYFNSVITERINLKNAKANYDEARANYDAALSSGASMMDSSALGLEVNARKAEVIGIENTLRNYYDFIASYYTVSNYKVGGLTPSNAPFNYEDELVVDTAVKNQAHIEATKAYEAKITAIYDDILKGSEATGNVSYMDKFKTYSKEIYPLSARKLILSPLVEKGGGMNIILVIVIPVAVGIILGCIVAFILGRMKERAEEQAASADVIAVGGSSPEGGTVSDATEE